VVRTEELAVVTVIYSPGEHLEEFLSSLDTATTLRPAVVLADNGFTDGAPEAALAAHERVVLLRTGENIGYGAAVNRAVPHCPSRCSGYWCATRTSSSLPEAWTNC